MAHSAKRLGTGRYMYRDHIIYNAGPLLWSVTSKDDTFCSFPFDAANTLKDAKGVVDGYFI